MLFYAGRLIKLVGVLWCLMLLTYWVALGVCFDLLDSWVCGCLIWVAVVCNLCLLLTGWLRLVCLLFAVALRVGLPL